jgi:hypothetical protein
MAQVAAVARLRRYSKAGPYAEGDDEVQGFRRFKGFNIKI